MILGQVGRRLFFIFLQRPARLRCRKIEEVRTLQATPFPRRLPGLWESTNIGGYA